MTSLLDRCGDGEPTAVAFLLGGLCAVGGGVEAHPSLGCPWALRSAPKWENLGVAAGRSVRLAPGHVLHGRQGSYNEPNLGRLFFGRSARESYCRPRKQLWGPGLGSQKTCGILRHPEWQSRSPKVVSETPPPCIGPQEFTDADLKIWMPMGMGCISALSRSRRYGM